MVVLKCPVASPLLSGLTIAKQEFGVATHLAEVFGYQPVDGILGLGWPALAVDKVTPPMQNLLSTLDQPLFTVWMDRKLTISNGGNAGLITYGAIDTKNCQSQVNYVPLSAETYWQFPIQGFTIGSFSETTKQQVISDTGTSWIGAPSTVVNGVVKQTGAKYDATNELYTVACTTQKTQPDLVFTINGVTYNVPSVEYVLDLGLGNGKQTGAKYDATNELYTVACTTQKTQPDLVFTINGVTYNVPSVEYVLDLGLGNGKCALTFFSMDAGGFGPAWILGDTWIRTYCNIYDIGQKRIGFAKANHSGI
ncbi:eukaryotic aspartyl protease [Oesophagostomum dentatum]|uniref:Eukaryotic aspartyl protease n=1 Tax=Oesophagostomum dentatum TaxID=61180 RepID=A0A0B1SLV7_OESDE|nr:eukaryotic aspartyl protease [Oesophagostomum dentatum]